MKERPMDSLVDALCQGNAQITYLEKNVFLFTLVAEI